MNGFIPYHYHFQLTCCVYALFSPLLQKNQFSFINRKIWFEKRSESESIWFELNPTHSSFDSFYYRYCQQLITLLLISVHTYLYTFRHSVQQRVIKCLPFSVSKSKDLKNNIYRNIYIFIFRISSVAKRMLDKVN